MRKSLIAVCLTGMLAGTTSCGTSNKAAVTLGELNGEWKITEAGGQPIGTSANPDEAFIGLNVEEKRLYGSTSCNRLLGSFEADADKGTISFGQAGSTRMACPDMETEQRVLDAINRTAAFEMQKDGSMTLKDKDGKAVMKVERK